MPVSSDHGDWQAPRVSYLICATARTGSSLLSDYLASTAAAGNPDEYFNTTPPGGALQPPTWLARRGQLAPREYLRLLTDLGSSENGVFGAKVSVTSFRELLDLLRRCFGEWQTDQELLATAYPGLRLLFATRLDKVAQAVSVLKALESDYFSTVNTGDTSQPSLRYNFPLIQMTIGDVVDDERRWTRMFAQTQLPFHVVAYEELSAHSSAVIEGVLRFLEIDTDTARPPSARLGRLSDHISEAWGAKHQRRMRVAHRLQFLLATPIMIRNQRLRDHYWSRYLPWNR
jgi:LPS sulfotransferase NodH